MTFNKKTIGQLKKYFPNLWMRGFFFIVNENWSVKTHDVHLRASRMLNLRQDSKRAGEMYKGTGQSEDKECKQSEAETQRDSTCYTVRYMQFS